MVVAAEALELLVQGAKGSWPYLLYCVFTAWHFHLHWWAMLIAALPGGILCASVLRDAYNPKKGLLRR